MRVSLIDDVTTHERAKVQIRGSAKLRLGRKSAILGSQNFDLVAKLRLGRKTSTAITLENTCAVDTVSHPPPVVSLRGKKKLNPARDNTLHTTVFAHEKQQLRNQQSAYVNNGIYRHPQHRPPRLPPQRLPRRQRRVQQQMGNKAPRNSQQPRSLQQSSPTLWRMQMSWTRSHELPSDKDSHTRN